jgi:2-amino-4-hydroxy-6-hydroxymethyldihydropteridine diphosphokinase
MIMAIAYLALGSNLGHREKNIQDALIQLEDHGIKILQRSALIETEPQGGPPQGKYLNGVIQIQTNLSPHNLLDLLKTIEKKLGRVEAVRNGPRPIDLDILLYDNFKIETAELTIPHPRMLTRDFVMNPLSEIAPGLAKELSHARD